MENGMKRFALVYGVALCCAYLVQCPARAQSIGSKEEIGFDLLYQGSHDVTFDGGSSVNLHDDLGFALNYTYRFSPQFDLQSGFDFQWLSDDANVQVASLGQSFRSTGSVHMFTPHVDGMFKFLPGDFTPYVSAGVGWTWIDTSIPSSPAYSACWWDPWWGYYCGVYQNTHSTNDFVYELGAGLRWDFEPGYTIRLGYQKRWIDMTQATGKPGFDQIRLNIGLRY